MFVVVQRKTIGTVAALLILAVVLGWAVRAERGADLQDGGPIDTGSGGGGQIEEAAPVEGSPQGPPSGRLTGATIPVVASSRLAAESSTRGRADDRSGPEWAGASRRRAPGAPDGAGVSGDLESYFEARLARDRARSRRIEFLAEVVLESEASEERKRTSQEELDAILRRAEIEVVSEGIIRNQGFSNPLVFAGPEGVSVVVSDTLRRNGAARIGETVARVAGVPRTSVVIVDGGQVAAVPQTP